MKDRASPYSRKHLKYWLPVLGGMILIGAINVGLGVCTYHGEPEPPREKIIPVVPAWIDAAPAPLLDAAVGPARPLGLDAGPGPIVPP